MLICTINNQMMTEVFKTNVTTAAQATELTALIGKQFQGYVATFDLEDCDRVLCVKCADGTIAAALVISFLHQHNCLAEILPDEMPHTTFSGDLVQSR